MERSKLKFKKASTVISDLRKTGKISLMRNGYRLATVEEARQNWEIIENYGFEKKMRLLDGYIGNEFDRRCLHISSTYVIKKAVVECDWEILVKEKEREILIKEKERNEGQGEIKVKEEKSNGAPGPWKKKKTACYESNGILLRKELYDNVHLEIEGKKIALALASVHGDSEVLCWLLKERNSSVLEEFKKYFSSTMSKSERHEWLLSNYINMVESLLASGFSLPKGENVSNRLPVVDYAIKCLNLGDPNYIGILIVEFLIEIYSKSIVDNTSLVDVVIKDGEKGNGSISIIAKLFSVYPTIIRDTPLNEDVLFVAIEKGYCKLVEYLLKKTKLSQEMRPDACQKVAIGAARKGCLECVNNILGLLTKMDGTLFHNAAESENQQVFKLLFESYKSKNEEITRDTKDTRGRNFLHWAALNGHAEICNECICEWNLKVEVKDDLGQNSLHFSAKGNNGYQVVDILIKSSSEELIHSRDDEGRTPLHFASAKGNLKWVEKIISKNPSMMEKCIKQFDGKGRTALQMAAAGGHKQLVQIFLDQGCDPLLQRDLNGCTSLHHAATKVKDAEVAIAISRCLLNKYDVESDKKSLLLWASAAGIGTADDSNDLSSYVKDFFLEQKVGEEKRLLEKDNTLLRVAAKNNNVEMAWELLNRGANIKDILDRKWKRKMTNIDPKGTQLMDNVNNVIHQIEIEKAQGPDRPSLEDSLGRNAFAEGLASLFLNKFVESPITVGISGEWGMGKSSLMTQTEKILLLAASQLTFPNLLRFEKFPGAEKISLSSKGQSIYWKIKNGASKLLAHPEDKSEKKNWNPLVELLDEYHPQYHAIYKSLACMDIDNQMLRSDFDRKSQFLPMRRVPRILTIRYNAWHYRDEHEAWAGLAVTITKEIEQAMTRAQRFSSCWKYSWSKNKIDIIIQIILPFLLVIFLSGWIAWIALTLLKDSKHKDLKYGSIPCTVIAIVWVALKSVISVVKPVSTQMMGYITSRNHSIHLGYQERVISDINFMKGELGQKPHWFFSMICGEWCWNWFGRLSDNVENTCIPKFSPAYVDQLRMIAFVDDLDRCDEKVILQVLSAINLVLAECKINVIVGIDKKVIQRTVKKYFEDNEDRDLAEKFICKIIQIPLSLPDPTKTESERFLAHLLGRQSPSEEDANQDGEDTDYGDLDTDNDIDDNEITDQKLKKKQSIVDIDCLHEPSKSCDGIIVKVYNWLACKLSRKNELNDMEIHPLTFSKGARLTREMVLSNYGAEEIDTLNNLRDFATGNQKLPREWKLLLTYRKLACNILSIIGKVHKHPNWKVELMAWIFICWQWKHEMNILVKGWKEYAKVNINGKVMSKKGEDEDGPAWKSIKGKSKVEEDEDQPAEDEDGPAWKSIKGKSKVGEDEDQPPSCKSKSKSMVGEDKVEPSLKDIVWNYILKLKELQQNNDKEVHLVEKTRELVKLKDHLGEDAFVKAILSMYGHDSRIDEEVRATNSWLNLYEALKVQDVTMKGIQLFQQFRLHCEADYLPWPLPEPFASKYERLASSKISDV